MKKIIEDFGEIVIGQNAKENWEIIDLASPTDIWFHLSKFSSCHLICSPNRELTNKEIAYLANMCKEYTKKCANMRNVYVNFTQVKNIRKHKTDIGAVFMKKYKTVKV